MSTLNTTLNFLCLNVDLLNSMDLSFLGDGRNYILLRKNISIENETALVENYAVEFLRYPLKEYVYEILNDTVDVKFHEVCILCRDVNADVSYFAEIIRFAFSKNKTCIFKLIDIKDNVRNLTASEVNELCKKPIVPLVNTLYASLLSMLFFLQFVFLFLLIPLAQFLKLFRCNIIGMSVRVCIAKRVHSNQSYILGKALKELDVKAVSVDLVGHLFGYHACDVTKDISKLNPLIRFLILDYYFLKFLFTCDVFLFENNGESFFVAPLSFDDWMLPCWFQKLELMLLKFFGKKIIFEMRDCTVYDRKDKLQQSIRNICKECNLSRVKAICRKQRYLEANKIAIKYADFLFCSTPELKEYLPKETLWLPNGFILDKERKEPLVQERVKVKIIHASSSRGMKGTEEAIAAIEILQKKHDVDFVLIEKMPHQETIAHIESADIVLGQLSCGTYGNFEIEAMAHSKPVICYIQEQFYGDVSVPFVNVDGKDIVNSVVKKCEELILDVNLRKKYARLSYDYVIKMHDYKQLGATVEQVIEGLV